MTRSLVTAVIPVYNGERHLREAVASALAQDYPALDVLVIDDGSTDGSAEIARSFGSQVRYHYQPNAGLSAARNAGVALARGKFIAFLDCDDLWIPEKTALQIEVFRTRPATDMVFGLIEQFYSPELGERGVFAGPDGTAVMPGYSACTLLARAGVFARAGHFDIEFRVGEFLDWYARASDAGLHSLMLDRVVLKRRIHENNMGVRDRDKRSDYLRVFKASLDRRRRMQNKAID
jgi:glycosyltransferase involved in cell wall biosynthesis